MQTVPRIPMVRQRLDGIDRVRGLAVVLMVLDHVLVALVELHLVTGPSVLGPTVVRLTLTRLSLPLFMWASGYLLGLKVPSLLRRAEVAIAAVCVTALLTVVPIGVQVPDPLVLWILVMLLAGRIRSHPVAYGLLGVTVSVLPWPFAGYHPGVVLALVALGVCSVQCGPFPQVLGERLPPAFGWWGRHALSLYLSHIAALCTGAVLLEVLR